MTKEIVIAAYDKDLSWMNLFNSDIKKTIYRKGVRSANDGEIFIELNMGRCVHSFFNHIYTNYDNLSDYTFFAQDYPFDHWENLIDVINNDSWERDATLKIGGYYGFHYNTIGSMWSMYPSSQFGGGAIISCLSNGVPQASPSVFKINLNEAWNIFFDHPNPDIYEFMPGGHFGITRDHARTRTRDFYKSVVDILVNDPDIPWVIERLECYMFDTKFKTKL